MSAGFGEYLVLRRKVSPRAVLHLLKCRHRLRPQIGELAARRGWLSWGQVLGVVGVMERDDRRFGETAVSMHLLTEAQVGTLLREQAAATLTLPQLLIDLKILTRTELDREQRLFEKSRPHELESLASS